MNDSCQMQTLIPESIQVPPFIKEPNSVSQDCLSPGNDNKNQISFNQFIKLNKIFNDSLYQQKLEYNKERSQYEGQQYNKRDMKDQIQSPKGSYAQQWLQRQANQESNTQNQEQLSDFQQDQQQKEYQSELDTVQQQNKQPLQNSQLLNLSDQKVSYHLSQIIESIQETNSKFFEQSYPSLSEEIFKRRQHTYPGTKEQNNLNEDTLHELLAYVKLSRANNGNSQQNLEQYDKLSQIDKTYINQNIVQQETQGYKDENSKQKYQSNDNNIFSSDINNKLQSKKSPQSRDSLFRFQKINRDIEKSDTLDNKQHNSYDTVCHQLCQNPLLGVLSNKVLEEQIPVEKNDSQNQSFKVNNSKGNLSSLSTVKEEDKSLDSESLNTLERNSNSIEPDSQIKRLDSAVKQIQNAIEKEQDLDSIHLLSIQDENTPQDIVDLQQSISLTPLKTSFLNSQLPVDKRFDTVPNGNYLDLQGIQKNPYHYYTDSQSERARTQKLSSLNIKTLDKEAFKTHFSNDQIKKFTQQLEDKHKDQNLNLNSPKKIYENNVSNRIGKQINPAISTLTKSIKDSKKQLARKAKSKVQDELYGRTSTQSTRNVAQNDFFFKIPESISEQNNQSITNKHQQQASLYFTPQHSQSDIPQQNKVSPRSSRSNASAYEQINKSLQNLKFKKNGITRKSNPKTNRSKRKNSPISSRIDIQFDDKLKQLEGFDNTDLNQDGLYNLKSQNILSKQLSNPYQSIDNQNMDLVQPWDPKNISQSIPREESKPQNNQNKRVAQKSKFAPLFSKIISAFRPQPKSVRSLKKSKKAPSVQSQRNYKSAKWNRRYSDSFHETQSCFTIGRQEQLSRNATDLSLQQYKGTQRDVMKDIYYSPQVQRAQDTNQSYTESYKTVLNLIGESQRGLVQVGQEAENPKYEPYNDQYSSYTQGYTPKYHFGSPYTSDMSSFDYPDGQQQRVSEIQRTFSHNNNMRKIPEVNLISRHFSSNQSPHSMPNMGMQLNKQTQSKGLLQPSQIFSSDKTSPLNQMQRPQSSLTQSAKLSFYDDKQLADSKKDRKSDTNLESSTTKICNESDRSQNRNINSVDLLNNKQSNKQIQGSSQASLQAEFDLQQTNNSQNISTKQINDSNLQSTLSEYDSQYMRKMRNGQLISDEIGNSDNTDKSAGKSSFLSNVSKSKLQKNGQYVGWSGKDLYSRNNTSQNISSKDTIQGQSQMSSKGNAQDQSQTSSKGTSQAQNQNQLESKFSQIQYSEQYLSEEATQAITQASCRSQEETLMDLQFEKKALESRLSKAQDKIQYITSTMDNWLQVVFEKDELIKGYHENQEATLTALRNNNIKYKEGQRHLTMQVNNQKEKVVKLEEQHLKDKEIISKLLDQVAMLSQKQRQKYRQI